MAEDAVMTNAWSAAATAIAALIENALAANAMTRHAATLASQRNAMLLIII